MRSVPSGPDRFQTALAQVQGVQARQEFEISEAPAPQRLAPSAVALVADLADPEDDSVSGRFVLLHDPDGVDEWGGSFRCVIFVRATLETDLIEDPMLHDVGWSWVQEALAGVDAHGTQIGGTITRTSGRSFGTMEDRPEEGFVEIRASWTPIESDDGEPLDDMGVHVCAWLDLMAHAAGMPPQPVGVTHVDTARRRSRG